MAEKKSIGKTLKRELVRAMLERSQGMDMSKMMERISGKEEIRYDDVEETLNIPYINRDEVPLAMDLFKPKVEEGKELPVIIMIHGGGLTMGDRGCARAYCRYLAHQKYLTFSLEYRLAPRANICMQLDDVCAGLDLIGRMLVDHDVDLTRIFLVADSAGAFLAAYVSAMRGSEKLQAAIGYKPTRMRFAAIGLICGMFYLNRKDPTGFMLAEQVYGEKRADETFVKFMNPEHPEIVNNIPPAFLITSKGDFMNNYTFMFHEALKKAGRENRLLYLADESLQHVFPITDPELPRSVEATEKMLAWFEEQAKAKKERQKKNPAVEKARKAVEARRKDGTINEQKIWSYIRERRTYDEKLLQNTAIIDCTREYSYAEMFEEWDKYARVFSALGMTDENSSRVALAGAITAEPIFAFYALNMTGAEVSLFSFPDFMPDGMWRAMLEKEKITDLILTDIMVSPQLWEQLRQAKEELGLRHIILMHSKMGGPCIGPAELVYNEVNYHSLEKLPDMCFLDRLITEHAESPIHYAALQPDKLALIAHTSGTTKGTRKPIPYTDTVCNQTNDLYPDGLHTWLQGITYDKPLRVLQHFDMSSMMAFAAMVNSPLAYGDTVVLTFFGFMHPKFIRAIDYYNIDVIMLGGFMLDKWLDRTDIDRTSFISLKVVGLSGSYIPPKKLAQYKEFMAAHGFKYDLTFGYGLSEAGGRQMVSHTQEAENDKIGIPEDPETIRIQDETDQQFYRLSDGERTGTLFIRAAIRCSNTLDGEELFSYTEIDGEDYLCTNDLVRVNADGSLSYAGRADRYFVNNDGKQFDAGIVEVQIQAHPAVEHCAVVPIFEKRIHDTVPMLYVVPADRSEHGAESIRQALLDVYVRERKLTADDLPVQFMLVGDIPLNGNGKADIYRITRDRLEGEAYNIEPVYEDGLLSDIRIEYIHSVNSMIAGTVPAGMDGRSSYNLFDVFTTPLPKQETPAKPGFPFMPWMQARPEKKKPEIPPELMAELSKFGTRMIGKLYGAKTIDYDIED